LRTHSSGQSPRTLVTRHAYVPTLRAVDNRTRTAPVALTADAPVTQAVLGARCAQLLLLEHFANGGEGTVEIQPVEFVGVDQLTLFGIGILPGSRGAVAGGGADHRPGREVGAGGGVVVRA